LYVEGTIEGNISLPGERVTIGMNGRVSANMMSSTTPCISAQELVIMGQVFGNVSATDRVEVREDGSLTGDIMTARVSIADGAFFKGGIDIRRPDRKPALSPSKNHGEAMHLTTSLMASTEKEPA
jgi:cytoskeletal protein CcmA (bactofilin family)